MKYWSFAKERLSLSLRDIIGKVAQKDRNTFVEDIIKIFFWALRVSNMRLCLLLCATHSKRWRGKTRCVTELLRLSIKAEPTVLSLLYWCAYVHMHCCFAQFNCCRAPIEPASHDVTRSRVSTPVCLEEKYFEVCLCNFSSDRTSCDKLFLSSLYKTL